MYRTDITVEKFNNSFLILHQGRNKIRMELQDPERHSFFDLLIADIIHAYIEQYDFSRAYPMPYVREFSLSELDISHKYQKIINEIAKGESNRLEKVELIINKLIEYFSNKNSEKFRLFSNILSLGVSDPEILRKIRSKLS